ncbi:MAG: hypothetical protein NUK57_08130 [Gudongella sp.]|nr:hypothetical protein [Gudongella sp.]
MSDEKRINPIFAIIIIPVAGFVLLNLSFLIAAGTTFCLHFLFRQGEGSGLTMLPTITHLAPMIVLLVLSYLALINKRIPGVFKAAFAMVPTAVLLAYTGIFFYNWPVAVYTLSSLIVAAILFYLYRTKRLWIYYYGVLLVSAALLYMQISGIDI